MASSTYLRIALPTPLRQLFDYLPPHSETPSSLSGLQPGIRVRVPFGNSEKIGILLALSDVSEVPTNKLKSATEIIDRLPVLPPEIIAFCQWTAEYYHYPLGEVLNIALPQQLRQGKPPASNYECWVHTTEGKGLPEHALKQAPKQQRLHNLLLQHQQIRTDELSSYQVSNTIAKSMATKGLIEKISVATARTSPPASDSATQALLAEEPKILNAEQEAVLLQIHYHQFTCYLLEGATGSGKTEVYMQMIARVLQTGRQVLVLVPEIGLTPQTIARFEKRFHKAIAVLHSGISEGQRSKTWQEAKEGHCAIVLGTRLAIFTPLPQLGMIIVDEEHDLSFKQQDNLRYSARDLAVIRAHKQQIPVVLGTATPSLESLHNAIHQRYEHLRLTQRAGQAKPPTLSLIDLRKESLVHGLSPHTLDKVRQTLEAENQVLIFVNRRGLAPAIICHTCGWIAQCHRCDANLTLHQQPYLLHCHHCEARRPVPTACPQCHNQELLRKGLGTEAVQEGLQAIFPHIRVIRVDQDSMSTKDAMAKTSAIIRSGEPCILVGTQILAKGHHFPHLTLAVILDADQGLFSPDFRGAERMGQLITQVAGRAGRGAQAGQVIIQSHQPDHPLLQTLLNQGYHRYARQLLAERQAALLPPFWSMVLIRAESKRAENALEFLQMVRRTAQQIQPPCQSFHYLGPIPAIMEKRQNRYRYQLQIKGAKRPQLQSTLKKLINTIEQHALSRRTRWSVDVDPLDFTH